MASKKIKVGTHQVTETELLTSFFNYVNQRYQSDNREIYLEADGEKKYVIVPTNFKQVL